MNGQHYPQLASVPEEEGLRDAYDNVYRPEDDTLENSGILMEHQEVPLTIRRYHLGNAIANPTGSGFHDLPAQIERAGHPLRELATAQLDLPNMAAERYPFLKRFVAAHDHAIGVNSGLWPISLKEEVLLAAEIRKGIGDPTKSLLELHGKELSVEQVIARYRRFVIMEIFGDSTNSKIICTGTDSDEILRGLRETSDSSMQGGEVEVVKRLIDKHIATFREAQAI